MKPRSDHKNAEVGLTPDDYSTRKATPGGTIDGRTPRVRLNSRRYHARSHARITIIAFIVTVMGLRRTTAVSQRDLNQRIRTSARCSGGSRGERYHLSGFIPLPFPLLLTRPAQRFMDGDARSFDGEHAALL
jgi:hypothetical protein